MNLAVWRASCSLTLTQLRYSVLKTLTSILRRLISRYIRRLLATQSIPPGSGQYLVGNKSRTLTTSMKQMGSPSMSSALPLGC